MPVTPQQATVQLNRLRNNGLAKLLNAGAVEHNLPLPFVYAICSRETNCINELGDFHDGDYHGVGIMQIDVGSWPLALEMRDNGAWIEHPERLIDIGCRELEANIQMAKQEWPTMEFEHVLQLAAAGYNAGMKLVVKLQRSGRSPDSVTTGYDYGRDVCDRMGVFANLLLGGDLSGRPNS